MPGEIRAEQTDVRDRLRVAMRQVVSSVAVVTTEAAGRPRGMTATAVSMVSLDPPALLVCVNRSSQLHPAILKSGQFRILFLGQDQCDVARAFGGEMSQEGRFAIGSWRTDAPYGPSLTSAVADIACDVLNAVDHGSHTIFIGAARAVEGNRGATLLYGDGGYRGTT